MATPPNPPTHLPFHTYDVFTSTPFAGNPLSIIHLPASLSPAIPQATRQLLAREFNLSETVFLTLPPSSSSSSVPEYPLQIFLTTAEVPLAGHPVVGAAAHVFARLLPAGSTRAAFLTKAGRCEVDYEPVAKRVGVDMPHAIRRHAWGGPDVGALQPGLAGGGAVRAVDVVSLVKGMAFVMVEVADIAALGRVGLYHPALSTGELDEGWREGVLMMMFYTLVDEREGTTRLRTRMVAGTFEDPATGSASCALAALLSLKTDREGETRFEMTQAVEMGRRSDIGVVVEVKGGEVERVTLSGTAVEIMEGMVRYA